MLQKVPYCTLTILCKLANFTFVLQKGGCASNYNNHCQKFSTYLSFIVCMRRNVENDREAPPFEVIRNAEIKVKEDEPATKGNPNVLPVACDFSLPYITVCCLLRRYKWSCYGRR